MTDRPQAKQPLTSLPGKALYIAPSILAADFSRLGDELRQATVGGADMVHIDIMDGHFVPNLSMGPGVVQAIRPVTDLPFDVHLMLSEPGRYLEPFVAAGADHITLHVESRGDLPAIIAEIHRLGCSAGLTLRPGTPAIALAGFGGQSFMAGQLPKIAAIRRMMQERGREDMLLQVDGGIAGKTAPQVILAGANVLVAGSSVFNAPNGIQNAISGLRALA
jgi:ribulose-phosphate 3-epimerase